MRLKTALKKAMVNRMIRRRKRGFNSKYKDKRIITSRPAHMPSTVTKNHVIIPLINFILVIPP
jgi:hypothetical protein